MDEAKGNEMDTEKNMTPDEKLPLEMELDLLVDEELPEERRRALLKSLDKAPGHWRELSIRFLERQVEKKSARQLLAAGAVKMPGRVEPGVENYQFSRRSWLTPMRMTGIAAGLLVAIGAVVVVNSMLHREETVRPVVHVGNPDVVDTKLPGSVAGMEIPVKVSVVDLRTDAQASRIFQQDFDGRSGSRQSIVIKPDALGNALVIPVKSLQVQ